MSKGAQGGKSASSSVMTEAWRLFDAGDKRAARSAAEKVLANPPSEMDAAEARDLLSRTAIPTLALGLALLALGCIVALVLLARAYLSTP